MRKNYTEIIGLPHPEPKRRARMKREKRAAQFMPFAALTGFEEEIAEEQHKAEQKND